METNPNNAGDFSLSEGGPFHRALLKMRLHNKQGKLALVGFCFTWVPLALITAIEGTLYSGTPLPFLKDVAMQARMLVALPMLILIKVAIDSKVIVVSNYISGSLISKDERQIIFTTVLQRAKKLTSSVIAEIILLLIVIAVTISLVKTGMYSALEGGTRSWMTSTKEGSPVLSVAGYWAVLVSIPMFQFLLLRWIWRYIVWISLLFRLSKARLNLWPTHADRAGGLGLIMMAQKSFNLVFVVGSVVLSGQFIAQIIEHPDFFKTIRGEAIAYIVISISFILMPLLFFTGKLYKTKNDGLLQLGILGAALSGKFDRKWVNDLPAEKRIEEKEVDPSILFDYAGLYDMLQKFRTVPVTLRDIAGMAIALFVPFIPILFIHFSVGELMQKIAGLLA